MIDANAAPRTSTRPWLRTVLWIVYWVALCVAARIPPATASRWSFNIADWILHSTAFAGLGFLTVWRTQSDRPTRRRPTPVWVMVWFGILIGYAALDERTQPWWGRHCELSDWLADLVGSSIGLLAAYAWSIRVMRRASHGADCEGAA